MEARDQTSAPPRDASGAKVRSVSERAAAAVSQAQPLDVIMAGPGLGVMGGVSAVERLLIEMLPSHVRVTHVATMVDGGAARKLWTFARALRRWFVELARAPALVHIHFSVRGSSVRKELLARIALAMGVRVIMHAHAGEYRLYWARRSRPARARTMAVLSRVSALIVLGESWREFFISIGVPAEKVVVMPNPVRLPYPVPARVASQAVTCVYLGLIAPKKGAFDLVEAVAALPQGCRERLRLVIAGNGQVVALRKAAQERQLTGSLEVREWLAPEQRDALLAAAEVFVLPSYNEGLPMALLEAMAFGAAPITTPVGGIPEVVRHDFNGLLVAPGDVPALAAALQRLIERPEDRAHLGRNARATVESLSIETYVDRLCSLYEDVASGRGPSARSAVEASAVRRRA
ncbi:MAG: glycosyltransferase family 4 protein [Steroidobacter sp.]